LLKNAVNDISKKRNKRPVLFTIYFPVNSQRSIPMNMLNQKCKWTDEQLLVDLIPNKCTIIKVYLYGQLSAGGKDRQLRLTINGVSNGYKSYTKMVGDYDGHENSDVCFLLGRNGWGVDAHFSSEISISILTNRAVLTGMSCFSLGKGEGILGYTCYGALNDNNGFVTKFALTADGGLISEANSVTIGYIPPQ